MLIVFSEGFPEWLGSGLSWIALIYIVSSGDKKSDWKGP